MRELCKSKDGPLGNMRSKNKGSKKVYVSRTNFFFLLWERPHGTDSLYGQVCSLQPYTLHLGRARQNSSSFHTWPLKLLNPLGKCMKTGSKSLGWIETLPEMGLEGLILFWYHPCPSKSFPVNSQNVFWDTKFIPSLSTPSHLLLTNNTSLRDEIPVLRWESKIFYNPSRTFHFSPHGTDFSLLIAWNFLHLLKHFKFTVPLLCLSPLPFSLLRWANFYSSF